MSNIDKAKQRYDEIKKFAEENFNLINSESDVRIHLIDRMLIEVLGWNRDGISTEPSTESGFIDYLISSGGRNVFVVEAKKAGKQLFSTKNTGYSLYKVCGPALAEARDGINQAARYCSEKAVPFSALSNGISWVGFRPVRTDGVPYKDGLAAAFPSLESINERFAEFYDLFSQEGVINRLYNIYLDRGESGEFLVSEPLTSVTPDSDIYLLKKTELAHELEQIFNEFFKKITGDNDNELLVHCFVETLESHEADRNLEKITREIVNYVQEIRSDTGIELKREIEASFETKKGQTVLIVGNKGAGKSTFIDRFFRHVLDRQTREKCLVIKIDLAQSSGNLEGLQGWLTERLIMCAERELYDGNMPDYKELVGIFIDYYRQWSTGVFKPLYECDRDAFEIKFGEFIFDLKDKKPYNYLIEMLKRAVRQRRVIPCIVFDNTDNFPINFQDIVFQYAYSIYREILSVVVVPITDRTIWRLSKAGALQSYPSKTFYLPVPSTKDVLKKRVLFIKRKLEETDDNGREYFSSRGLRVKIENFHAFAACVEEAFIKTDYVSRKVGWLSNYDIRRSLELSQGIITAPILKMEDLVASYYSKRSVNIPEYRITQALLFGSYNKFRQDAHDFILNLFAIEDGNISSPLLRMSILRLFFDKECTSREALGGYMKFEEVEHYFEAMGILTRPLVASISELMKLRLLEPYEPTFEHITPTTRMAITFSGRMHLEMALNDGVYLGQMALTTPIRSEVVVREIRDISSKKMDYSDWVNVRKVFAKYCLDQDRVFVSIPNHQAYSTQDILRKDFRSKWIT